MSDCSDLSKRLTEIAMLHATDPSVKNLDDIVALMERNVI